MKVAVKRTDLGCGIVVRGEFSSGLWLYQEHNIHTAFWHGCHSVGPELRYWKFVNDRECTQCGAVLSKQHKMLMLLQKLG